ncbi:MAG: hypothetical protein ACRC67_14260 [Inquilinus sp.]|uniref:hypothetical protein n=1 Tax=Inquilinus sp. TaxID=1932117 RepID=UPI003F39BFA1
MPKIPTTRRTKTSKRPVHTEIDDRGRRIVHVPLAPAGVCRIEEADYQRVMALGCSPNWGLISTGEGSSRHVSVRTTLADKSVAVARLVLDAPARSQVRFHGRDRTDLRRSSIFLKETNARGEGCAVTGRIHSEGWVSIAGTLTKNPTKAALIAAEKAHAEALERAAQVASGERVARLRAWVEDRVAAGADRAAVTAEAMAQAKTERRAWNLAHGLDENGRAPRPLAMAKRGKAGEAHPMGTPAALAPETLAALPFRSA